MQRAGDEAVLCDRDFETLRCELGDDNALVTFVGTYLELLPCRLHNVRQALSGTECEPDGAVMNLAAISQMIGARRLASRLELLGAAESPNASPEALPEQLRYVSDAARATRQALERRIDQLRCATRWRGENPRT